ncbi:MAG: SDR family oxidoreductase [Acidobacteriota bacterium]
MSAEMENSLVDRVALVTGGAVRLGRETVLALAERGARVAFTYSSSREDAESLLAELGDGHLALPCDVTEEEEVEAAFQAVDAELGRLDLLVNNAAIFEPPVDFADLTTETWRRHLDVNLTGSFLCAHRAGERMRKQEDGGLIVNIGCAGGLRPWPKYLPYSVSKAGVLMMTQCLARALAPKVRCNAVLPGPVLLPERYDVKQADKAIARTVLKRAGRPQDVVRAILFCWDSDYTTGAFIPVEGGRLLT